MKFTSLKNKVKGAVSYSNRRCFSANGFSLLPLALEQRLFCSAILLTLVMTVFISAFSGNPVSATASTLSLTVSSSTLSLDLKPISLEGTFARSSGSVNIGVNTNNSSGFTLKFAASTVDDRTLSDGNGNGLSPITTAIDADTFSGSDTTYNNKWGYLPSRKCTTVNKVTTCENNTTNYFPAPTTTGDILDVTNAANASSVSSDDSTYTIAIGARANTETKMGVYEGTFVITAVANPIPYTINYNSNTEDTVTNMPATKSGSATAETVKNVIDTKVPARTGYNFLGWCSTTTSVSGDKDTCSGTVYNPNGNGSNRNYTLDQTGSNINIVLYAMWQRAYRIEFVASTNINSIMVADGNRNYRPQYAVDGASNGSTVLSVPVGTKLIVTVIPESEYILDTWSSDSNSTTRLASTTLLTTTYTSEAVDETLTVTGKSGSYDIMQNLDLSIKDENNPNESKYCPTSGINVTDSRDKKSYTVAMFGNYCYMLSDLRLDNTISDGNGNTTARVLTSADSDITPNATYMEFTMPTEAWISSSQNYFCKAIMKTISSEYYYNWYAAKANPYSCTNPTSSANATAENDAFALGSICPKGWTLPVYSGDIAASMLWDNGNPGMLAASGYFSGSQGGLGRYGGWWSSARYILNSAAYRFYLDGSSVGRNFYYDKFYGFSVRCMRVGS